MKDLNRKAILINMNAQLLEKMDRIIKAGEHSTRQEFIREAIRRCIEHYKAKYPELFDDML